MPANDNLGLRDQCLALMALAPMAGYAADALVAARVGKLFADQADERDRVRRLPQHLKEEQ